MCAFACANGHRVPARLRPRPAPTLPPQVRKLTTELHAVETSHDTKQETGKAVQEEIKRMQAIVSAGPDWTAEQKAAKRELESELSQLNSHLKEKQNTQSVLQRDVSMLTDLIKAGTEATAALVREKEDVQTAATGVSRNTRSLESKKELVDRELKSLQQTLDSLRGAVADKEAALRAAEGDVAARERANKVIDTQIAQVAASGALIAKKTGELTEELDGQMVRSQSLLTELDAIEGRTRKYDAETATIRAETSRCGQLYELCLSKLGDAEQELAAVRVPCVVGGRGCVCVCVRGVVAVSGTGSGGVWEGFHTLPESHAEC